MSLYYLQRATVDIYPALVTFPKNHSMSCEAIEVHVVAVRRELAVAIVQFRSFKSVFAPKVNSSLEGGAELRLVR